MHEFEIDIRLTKILKRISKKDVELFNAITKKIEQILNCEGINHYKNLKKPKQEFKRVHIKTSFVLVFKYIEAEDKILFYDLDHHDNIYK